jgi:hypothetical protein
LDSATSGQRAARRARASSVERVVVELDALALGKEDVEGGVGQLRVVAGLLQRAADGFTAQRAQVVAQVRQLVVHLLANRAQCGRVGKQGGGGRCMLAQPAVQHLLGTPDGGPDRPQRVVQIEADGTDFRYI